MTREKSNDEQVGEESRPIAAKRRRPSVLAIAIVAAALLLGGTGGAVAHGKIGTKQLKNGAVTTKKIHKNAVTSKKIKNGSVSKTDLARGARPKPPKAYRVQNGGGSGTLPAGVWTNILSLDLPPGTWMIMGKGISRVDNSGITCDLRVGTSVLDRTEHVNVDSVLLNVVPMTLTQVWTLSGAGQVRLQCLGSGSGQPASIRDTKIVAVRVAP